MNELLRTGKPSQGKAILYRDNNFISFLLKKQFELL